MENQLASDAFISLMITDVLCTIVLKGQKYVEILKQSLNFAVATGRKHYTYFINSANK